MNSSGRTLLDTLVRQRHLTRNEARELLRYRAARMGVTERGFALSERQFYRLLHGEVKTLPHPVVCRVIEAEFGYPIRALLSSRQPAHASLPPQGGSSTNGALAASGGPLGSGSPFATGHPARAGLPSNGAVAAHAGLPAHVGAHPAD
jgi:hypothetical protein